MKDLPLGKTVSYPKKLDRSVLRAIERLKPNKNGFDLWSCFELACLDSDDKPKNFWLQFSVPADSPRLVESKSLKLYLGSFYKTAFSSTEQIIEEISTSLADITGSKLTNVELLSEPYQQESLSLETLSIKPIDSLVDKSESESIEFTEELANEILFFNHFRALCPVTFQPDHATVVLSYSGKQFSHASYANFLRSMSDKQGFHENWAEEIFAELDNKSEIDSFSLALFFSRRGGISINPIRYTENYSGPPLAEYFDIFKFLR